MNVRRATAGDRETLLDLGLLFHATSPYRELFALTREPLEALVAFLLEDNDHAYPLLPRGAAFLLEANDVAVGMIAGVTSPNHLTGLPCVTEVAFYIHPGYRLGNAWSELVDALETWGRDQQAATSQVVQPAGAKAVGRLYRRRGYVELETVFFKPLEARS